MSKPWDVSWRWGDQTTAFLTTTRAARRCHPRHDAASDVPRQPLQDRRRALRHGVSAAAHQAAAQRLVNLQLHTPIRASQPGHLHTVFSHNAEKELLLKWCQGNTQAMAYLKTLGQISQIADDFVDGDTTSSDKMTQMLKMV